MDLHVWGNSSISIIDPESRASAWLLSLHLSPQDIEFKIVPSSNTNLADSRKLPLLIVRSAEEVSKYEGFAEISRYISGAYPSDTKFIPSKKLSSYEQLMDLALTTYLTRTLHYINQYNLYVNSKNYELYTRKLFSRYLPFPMMYNQPLRFYENACEQVQIVGLSENKSSLFGFSGSATASEALDEDEDDEDDTVAISALHEKALLSKEKNKASLKEIKNSFRCLGLLNTYIKHITGLFKEINPEAPVEFAYLFRPKKISSCELLLYSYFYSLTSVALPDKFIAENLEKEFPAFWSFASTITEALNSSLDKSKFRMPQGAEVPSLWNEIQYVLGVTRT